MTTKHGPPPLRGELLLAGAIVRQALVLPFAAALSVRFHGENLVILLAAGRTSQGLGILAGEARTGKADLAGMVKAGAAIAGARVVSVSDRGVQLVAHDAPWSVAVERAQRRVVVRPGALEGADAVLGEDARAGLLARGPELAAEVVAESLARAREALRGSLDRATRRIARRITAIGQDIDRVAEAEVLSSQAQWLVAEAARAPRGARSLSVTDWSSGEPKVIELPLDPARTAREQVEALFKKARRIKRGVAVATERQRQAQERHAALDALSRDAAAAETHDALDAIVRRARAAAPGDFAHDPDAAARAPGAARPQQPRRKAYRTFRASTGARILVGRGGADNDELTLHVARPHDLWLHARGHPGAHVVVPLDKGHSCPPEALVDAAHLAAHFSDARGEPVVEIEHTDRRFVRKPRGSAAGLVVVQREKVLTLRVDPERVAALVASETDGTEGREA
jgi:hypothetical protein